MTREDIERARRVDAILRKLGIPTPPRRELERGPVMEGDGRTISRRSGSVLRVR